MRDPDALLEEIARRHEISPKYRRIARIFLEEVGLLEVFLAIAEQGPLKKEALSLTTSVVSTDAAVSMLVDVGLVQENHEMYLVTPEGFIVASRLLRATDSQ